MMMISTATRRMSIMGHRGKVLQFSGGGGGNGRHALTSTKITRYSRFNNRRLFSSCGATGTGPGRKAGTATVLRAKSSYATGSGVVFVTLATLYFCNNEGNSMLAEASNYKTGDVESKHPFWNVFGGGASIGEEEEEKGTTETTTKDDEQDTEESTANESSGGDFEEANKNDICDGGPGKKVRVDLDPELVEDLPVMGLEDVRKCNGTDKSQEQILVTYEGIVYDITQFIHNHPGGKELALTAAGLDLDFFFGNFLVHGNSEKAARWLAPLAVGKLSAEDCHKSKTETTATVHETKRMEMLNKKRRNILIVVSTMPFWISVRNCVGFIGYFLPSLGRFLANTFLPIPVPGLSTGTERLLLPPNEKTGGGGSDRNKTECEGEKEEWTEKPYSVAIIGGGIAGCGAGWALAQSGQFNVTLYEARSHISGNAKTFDWDFSKYGRGLVRSCVSVTAWPPLFYKHYTALLEYLNIETVPMPLSWFLHSKVPGYEGILWEADPNETYDSYHHDTKLDQQLQQQRQEGAKEEQVTSLRKVFEKDFRRYSYVINFSSFMANLFKLKWTPLHWNDTDSMYDELDGFGPLNPLNLVPLYSLFKFVGGSEEWWDIIFTPQYTASFLVDNLRPFPAVFGPKIEKQIPLLPNSTNSWKGKSDIRGDHDCNITTCWTWKDAGHGIQKVFELLTKDVSVKVNTRVLSVEILNNGKKRIVDEHNNTIDVDRVIFACPANAVSNLIITPNTSESDANKSYTYSAYTRFLMDTIFSTPVYADDHHPSAGHMHAIMHGDDSIIDEKYRDDILRRASNHVEITATTQKENDIDNGKNNGGAAAATTKYHIENNYNFGVQTPGPGIYDLPLDKKPVMLISHTLGDNKTIEESKIHGTGHHARAHPLYSGWNVMSMLSLRLLQGKYGIYYCSNWTTPGNTHDMSLLSGIVVAHAIGATYPFETNVEAKKDFHRMRKYMGV